MWSSNVEFGSVQLHNVELFGLVECGMSVVEFLSRVTLSPLPYSI